MHGLDGIGDQIQKHLLQLDAVASHLGQVSAVPHRQIDRPRLDIVANEQ